VEIEILRTFEAETVEPNRAQEGKAIQLAKLIVATKLGKKSLSRKKIEENFLA